MLRVTNITIILIMMIILKENAQTGSRIFGKVTDQINGNPIIGASITILGTELGASSDFNGNYIILKIHPGLYKIKASFFEYKSVISENIKVAPGSSSTLNFRLSHSPSDSTRRISKDVKSKCTIKPQKPLLKGQKSN